MESAESSTWSQHPKLPPGFRFHPTDEELVVHYLKRKAALVPLPASIIADIDLYKFDPWELPAKATFGEQEWYFFSPRERKYPNGLRPNRSATSGYWKATGIDKPVMSSGGTQKVGVKKALVFYGGKPPKGIKTNWIMHEYRIVDNKANTKPPGCDVGNKKGSLWLDDWVLCRIYKKNNTQTPMGQERDDSMNNIITSMPPPPIPFCPQNPKLQTTLKSSNYGAFLENDQTLFEGMIDNDCINNNGYSKTQMINLKRTLPSLYWNDESTAGGTSLTKRLFINVESSDNSVVARAEEQSNSIATLFSQLPQTHPLHQQTYEQSPVAYQLLPGMNWYSSRE